MQIISDVDDAKLLRLHATAQQQLDELLAHLSERDLDRPTPCPAWNLGALLAHMFGQNLGLERALAGSGEDMASWAPADLGPDPREALRASADRVVTAFADPSAMQRPVWMPEVAPGAPLPGRVVLLAHLVDTVTHGWDVARALGQPFKVPSDVLAATAAVALRIDVGDSRQRPGAAFGPPVEVSDNGTDDIMAVMLAHLGRNPNWQSADR